VLVLSGLSRCLSVCCGTPKLPRERQRQRSPRKRIYLVNATGTHPVGNTDYAQTIWQAASPSPALVS
jgi:hypothetical protein